MIQELQQEFSLSPETKRRLHIFIGGFMILLREWLQNENLNLWKNMPIQCLISFFIIYRGFYE